jgi:hypothetical protein
MNCAYHLFFLRIDYWHNNCWCCKERANGNCPCSRHEGMYGSGGLPPLILMLGTRLR